MADPTPEMREEAGRIANDWWKGCLLPSSRQRTVLATRIAAALAAERERGMEEAALWHDQRARDTPDAFEMELHQASAAAIRSARKEPQT